MWIWTILVESDDQIGCKYYCYKYNMNDKYNIIDYKMD